MSHDRDTFSTDWDANVFYLQLIRLHWNNYWNDAYFIPDKSNSQQKQSTLIIVI